MVLKLPLVGTDSLEGPFSVPSVSLVYWLKLSDIGCRLIIVTTPGFLIACRRSVRPPVRLSVCKRFTFSSSSEPLGQFQLNLA